MDRFSLYRHLFVEERPETSSARINLMVDYLAFTLYFPREWRTMQLITFGIDLTNPSVACGIIFGAILSVKLVLDSNQQSIVSQSGQIWCLLSKILRSRRSCWKTFSDTIVVFLEVKTFLSMHYSCDLSTYNFILTVIWRFWSRCWTRYQMVSLRSKWKVG